MSRTFNMVVGGGGKAVLAVAVTNGTATNVTATKSGVSVSLTYSGGIWSAELPSFGAWTVTITDGTHSNSATVNATQAGLYSVSIFMPDVPSAYTQLEYLESTGTQRISTGITPTSNSKVSVVFSGFTQSGYYTIAGSDNGWTNSGFVVGYYSVFNNAVLTVRLIADGERHTVDLSASGIYVDGALKYGPFSGSFTGTPFSLFCLNRNGNYQKYSNVKIYSCKLYQTTNTISRNLVPARRNSDSVLGMYDTVNDAFYTNAGTGSFIAGPAV